MRLVSGVPQAVVQNEAIPLGFVPSGRKEAANSAFYDIGLTEVGAGIRQCPEEQVLSNKGRCP
jgi:hypothetical protein